MLIKREAGQNSEADATGNLVSSGEAFDYNGGRMLKGLIDWYLARLGTGGYPLIGLLMAIESSIVPLPSELIIPPAAHLAYTHQTALGIPGIILAGTFGSWLGATVMYWASRLAGRPLALRYGRYVLISRQKIEGAERWAAHYGSMGVFISRLLPVVRHLIGIPAGIVRLDYRLYSLYTILGSAAWCGVLCYVGIKMGQDQELMKGQAHRISMWLGGAMLVLGAMYYLFVYRQMKVPKPGSRI
ncbi:MAG TPA: DedA family protein [Verrucomicrobiae bacterium]|nr:DedA family protein [Verrucomicrobiae bacterium]